MKTIQVKDAKAGDVLRDPKSGIVVLVVKGIIPGQLVLTGSSGGIESLWQEKSALFEGDHVLEKLCSLERINWLKIGQETQK